MVSNYSETDLTCEEFNEIINNSCEVVVVNFFSEWRMPCLMMTPIIDDLAEQFNQIRFVKICIDENDDISLRYKISNVPCLLIFKKGKEVDRISGNHSYDIIENKIKVHIG